MLAPNVEVSTKVSEVDWKINFHQEFKLVTPAEEYYCKRAQAYFMTAKVEVHNERTDAAQTVFINVARWKPPCRRSQVGHWEAWAEGTKTATG